MTPGIDMPRAAYRRQLAALLVGAAVVRIALLAYVAGNPGPFDFPDSHRYVRVARNIAAGNGPVESPDVKAGTDPVYPLLLASGIRLGIDSTSGIMMFGRAVNSACGVLLVAIVASIGRRRFSSRVALFAATWTTVDPILLFFNGLALTELPYILLLTAAVRCIIGWRDSARLRFAVLAGALLGIATLTRSSALLLPPLMAAWLLLGRDPANGNSRRLRQDRIPGDEPTAPARNAAPNSAAIAARRNAVPAAIGLLLAAAAVMSPIVYRNARLFGAFVPVRTGSGASLMEALGPWADGGPGMDRIEYPPFPPGADEVGRDRICRRAAWDWARAHPRETLRLAVRKMARTWSITINAPGFQSGFHAAVCWLTVAPIFALALVGAWRCRHRPRLLALLLLPAAYFTLVHVVFVGSVRYRLPALPFVFLLAAVGLDALIGRIDRRRADAES